MSADDYRTANFPYLSIDVKTVMQKFKVGNAELAQAIGLMNPLDLRNALRSDTRRFTKEEYFVILKACNEILENREMVEDLI